MVLLFLCAACTHNTQLQVAQTSHDALALSQDTEARLCWNVTGVSDAIAKGVTPNHCSSQVATMIQLTDARHQAFNKLMAQALEQHANLTKLLRTGTTVDFTAYTALLSQIQQIIAELTQSNTDVNLLSQQVRKAALR
jgi:hypothetical protein